MHEIINSFDISKKENVKEIKTNQHYVFEKGNIAEFNATFDIFMFVRINTEI